MQFLKEMLLKRAKTSSEFAHKTIGTNVSFILIGNKPKFSRQRSLNSRLQDNIAFGERCTQL